MQAADGRGLRCAPITHYCFSRIEFAASHRLLRFLTDRCRRFLADDRTARQSVPKHITRIPLTLALKPPVEIAVRVS
jgi:hypothetical protein